MSPPRVAILGGGNMGSAIARAINLNRATFSLPIDAIIIAEPDSSRRESLIAIARTTSSAHETLEALDPCGLVILAVKPQVFPDIARELGDIGPRLVISVMAGRSAAGIHRDLGGRCRVVRAMPNLPITVNQGLTALSPGPGATSDDLVSAQTIFSTLGATVEVPESLFDAFTAVASSGPAYIFYLAEAMTTAAVRLGFGLDQARVMVARTIRGASHLLGDEDPAALRARVTSRGGTTQAAISVLDDAHVAEAVIQAIAAARDRGRELAQD